MSDAILVEINTKAYQIKNPILESAIGWVLPSGFRNKWLKADIEAVNVEKEYRRLVQEIG